MNIREETLKIARNLIKKDPSLTDWVISKFPELQESGDERIRKALIKSFNEYLKQSEEAWNKDVTFKYVNVEEVLAWLEKQGNLMKALQISNAKIGELIEKNYYLKEQLEKQGELKKHDVCDNCEQQGSCVSPCPMKLVEKQGEQNPVVNDNAKEMFIKALERVEEQNNKGYKLTDCDKNSWWEDFKAYTSCTIEQKPAWSEEDEKQARQIERIVHDDGCTQKLQKQIADWFKSLKERCNWKPSDEQMDALRYVTNFDYGGYKATLVSLYEQLKKLRGE